MPLAPLAPSLESLELFVSVVDLGSVSKAADVHGISQPSASARIADLENLLHMQLLTRSPHGSSVTNDGEEIYKYALDILRSAKTLMDKAIEISQGNSGRIKIWASYSIAEYLIPAWLEKMQKQFRHVVPELNVSNSAQVIKNIRLNSGLGFVETEEIPSDLKAIVVSRDELWVVTSRDSNLAGRKTVSPRQLAQGPLIMREKGSGTRDRLEQALAHVGIRQINVKAELGSTTAVKAALGGSSGFAVLSNLAVESEIERGTLTRVHVHGIDLRRDLYAVWSSQSGIGHLERALIRVITGK